MAKLRFSSIILLLQAVAALAAPNAAPASLQLALPISAASALATPTATPAAEATTFHQILKRDGQYLKSPENVAAVLAKRIGPVTSLSVTLHNSFTNAGNSSITSSTAVTSASVGGFATGEFTGADGGVYGVTSQSGYVVVDGKTLAPGQSALIGQEEVADGTAGLVAGGTTVMLTPITTTAAPSTAVAASTTSSASSTMATSSASMAASSVAASTASASAAASSSSAAAAVATQHTGNAIMAGVGGLLVLMLS